jgi:hypothetical protein
MTLLTSPTPKALGHVMDTSPDAFGEMTDSSDIALDAAALRQRIEQDGYLYLPGLLDRDRVLDARRVILERLRASGCLDPSAPLMDGVLNSSRNSNFRPDLTENNPPLMDVLYRGAMIELYQRLIGGPVRHFDFTWLRSVGRGKGTPPHLDSVYMNRGTHRLYTSWTPLGDIALEQGGLAVLPQSHRIDRLREGYGMKDVDTFCTNLTPKNVDGYGGINHDGHLSQNPVRLRKAIGQPWLTRSQYRAGDVVIFTIFTIHTGLDNQTDRIRLSSDSRYQSASEPADERWISIDGAKPIGHGQAAKRGMIC